MCRLFTDVRTPSPITLRTYILLPLHQGHRQSERKMRDVSPGDTLGFYRTPELITDRHPGGTIPEERQHVSVVLRGTGR